jgi:hypothetical protein
METAHMRTAVVGAGPAGLAAALRLHAAGASVTVFEAADAVGGRTRSDLVDGWRVDPAVQLYSSGYATVRGLLRAAGGEGLLARSPGRDALWRKGRAHEVVYGSPTSMLASGALPLSLKLKMGAKYPPSCSGTRRSWTWPAWTARRARGWTRSPSPPGGAASWGRTSWTCWPRRCWPRSTAWVPTRPAPASTTPSPARG